MSQSEVNFYKDYDLLKHYPRDTFIMSRSLTPEIIDGGIERYSHMYNYFWSLIEHNRQNCQTCRDSTCLNRDIFIKLKNDKREFSENDLYLLMYIGLYFLDLIIDKLGNKYKSLSNRLSISYYILSHGHDTVIDYIVNGKQQFTINTNQSLDYNGYLLSVVLYFIPDFKYKIINQ